MNELDMQRDRRRLEDNLRLIEENRQRREQLQAEYDGINHRHGVMNQEDQSRLKELERLMRELDRDTERLKVENESIVP